MDYDFCIADFYVFMLLLGSNHITETYNYESNILLSQIVAKTLSNLKNNIKIALQIIHSMLLLADC